MSFKLSFVSSNKQEKQAASCKTSKPWGYLLSRSPLKGAPAPDWLCGGMAGTGKKNAVASGDKWTVWECGIRTDAAEHCRARRWGKNVKGKPFQQALPNLDGDATFFMTPSASSAAPAAASWCCRRLRASVVPSLQLDRGVPPCHFGAPILFVYTRLASSPVVTEACCPCADGAWRSRIITRATVFSILAQLGPR
jgi:hypothetical protein